MSSDWEKIFKSWAAGPGEAEEERCANTINMINRAIESSPKLSNQNVRVFLQGSYKNRVNVRQDSDVDVGILHKDIFIYDIPHGYTAEDFGFTPSNYKYHHFKDDVEEALVSMFGNSSVRRSNKTFNVKETSYRVEADVTPFFRYRHYSDISSYDSGVALRTDNGHRIVNWPEQHYKNGELKNTSTSRRYKQLVRVLKKLCYEMADKQISEAQGIPGFLCECLMWNVPDRFIARSTYYEALRGSLAYLHEILGTSDSDEWKEVSELVYLFKGNKPWTKQQARNFIQAAWQYVGYS